jgi:hypothetical protein
LSIYGNVAVVGAYGKDVDGIYFGTTKNAGDLPSSGNTDTGIVYVFQRLSATAEYTLFQVLEPSNVRQFDQFGWDVFINENKIMVGSVQNILGTLPPSKCIQEIKTVADYNQEPVGTGFKIKWMTYEDGSMRTTRQISYDTTGIVYIYAYII